MQRKIMGKAFNILVNTLVDVPYRDTQCGFKAFRTPLAKLLFHLMTVDRFAFDVEVLCLARQLRMEDRRSSRSMAGDEAEQGQRSV